MPRFYLPPESWPSGLLAGDEARHLSQVLRTKTGSMITVFDGCGNSANATVQSISRDEVALSLEETIRKPPIRPAISLWQAIPKQKNMDLIVQKAVELGVSAIHPLITRHTVVHPRENKAEKWRRTALEACKQCGQDTLPTVHDPVTLEDQLAQHADSSIDTLKVIASLAPGAKPLREILQCHPEINKVSLLIGPEGDFSPEETSAALAAEFLPATLGSIILRVETATLFCLSALRYQYSE